MDETTLAALEHRIMLGVDHHTQRISLMEVKMRNQAKDVKYLQTQVRGAELFDPEIRRAVQELPKLRRIVANMAKRIKDLEAQLTVEED